VVSEIVNSLCLTPSDIPYRESHDYSYDEGTGHLSRTVCHEVATVDRVSTLCHGFKALSIIRIIRMM